METLLMDVSRLTWRLLLILKAHHEG